MKTRTRSFRFEVNSRLCFSRNFYKRRFLDIFNYLNVINFLLFFIQFLIGSQKIIGSFIMRCHLCFNTPDSHPVFTERTGKKRKSKATNTLSKTLI